MPSPIVAIAIAFAVAAIASWRYGHGGIALTLTVLGVSLYLSAYVRALRPPGARLLRRAARTR